MSAMELEMLSKDDFTADVTVRGDPGIRFHKSGLVSINKSAVKHLKLGAEKSATLSGVSFLRDLKHPSDLFLTRDDKGWPVRFANKTEKGGVVVFNNVALCHHVIDVTWACQQSHPVGAEKPHTYCFGIALLPADDGKYKNVYALLRKKE
jgi:hypothetical protein